MLVWVKLTLLDNFLFYILCLLLLRIIFVFNIFKILSSKNFLEYIHIFYNFNIEINNFSCIVFIIVDYLNGHTLTWSPLIAYYNLLCD